MLYEGLQRREVRAITIGVQVGVSTYIASEPGMVMFVQDVGIGYAKWEDAMPGNPTNVPQWIGFGAGAAAEFGQYLSAWIGK